MPKSNPKRKINAYESVVKPADLSDEDLRSVIEQLLARDGLIIIREQTPDYTSVEVVEHDQVDWKNVP